MEDAQVANYMHKLGTALFGEAAITPGKGRRLHAPANAFTSEVMVNAWHAWRTGAKRQKIAIVKLETLCDEQWSRAYDSEELSLPLMT